MTRALYGTLFSSGESGKEATSMYGSGRGLGFISGAGGLGAGLALTGFRMVGMVLVGLALVLLGLALVRLGPARRTHPLDPRGAPVDHG